MLVHLVLLVAQLLYNQVHAADTGPNLSKDIVNDDSNTSATVLKARKIMEHSKFHTFVGKLEGPGEYRLKHLCSYSDSTFIFEIAPELRSGSTVLGFIDHELFLSMENEDVYAFISLSIHLDKNNYTQAYAHTLALLRPTMHDNLFQGVIFDRGSGRTTINIIFKQDTDPDLIKAFYQSFTIHSKCDFSVRPSALCFEKVVKKLLQNSWDLRVADRNVPLLVLDDYEVIVHLFALIPAMLLHGLALVRSGANIEANELPMFCLQACSMKVDKLVTGAIHNVELKDITVLGCRLSRGLDSIVAISFGHLIVESSGRNLVGLHLTIDPAQLPENGIASLSEAIVEMDGYFQYSEKYLSPKESCMVGNKPAVLEYHVNKVSIFTYMINSTEGFVNLANEPWAREPLQEEASFRLRHPSPRPVTTPFTLIGYATFPNHNLPAIANRIYDMLFVTDANEWIDLVEYVDLKPAKSHKEISELNEKFELIIAFHRDPIIDKLNIKELMADIMGGVSGAGVFSNGLIKTADGTIAILQRSTDKYYQERTDDINRRIRYTQSNSRATEQSSLNDFDVYCVILSATMTLTPIGTFTSIFDDTFLEGLQNENRAVSFLLLSKGNKEEMLDIFVFEMSKSRLPGFISDLKKWNLSAFPAETKNVLQMIFIEVPAMESSEKIKVGLGFGTSSPPELHSQCASMLKLSLAGSSKTGQMVRPNPNDAPMDPLEAPWSLSFGQEDWRTTRIIEGLTQLQIFICFLDQAALSTVEISLSGPGIESNSKIALYLKADYLRCILFEDDIWNMFEGKSQIAMWNELFKVKISSVPNRPGGELRTEIFVQPDVNLTILAGLLTQKLIRLVMVESYGLKSSPDLVGQLRVGNYRTQIKSKEEFLKSIARWPKNIGHYDVLSFERTGTIVQLPSTSKSLAVRLIVNAERLQHILAICIETLVDPTGNKTTIRDSQFIIRTLKSNPVSAMSNKRKKPFTHAECIWLPPLNELNEKEAKIFAQLFKIALEFNGITTQDHSMGIFDTKTLVYTQSQKLTFEANILLKQLEGYCELFQNKRLETKQQEAPKQLKMTKPVQKPQQEAKSTREPTKSENLVELPERRILSCVTVAEVRKDLEVAALDALPSTERILLDEKDQIQAPVEEPVTMEKVRPKVQAISKASSFVSSSRRRNPCASEFTS